MPYREVTNKLRRGETDLKFRNIPMKKCEDWLPHVGRKGAHPSAHKIFRLHKEDLETLRSLSNQLGISETAVVKKALHQFASEHSPREKPSSPS